MYFLGPEDNLSSLAQIIRADRVNKYVIERIGTYKSKDGINNICHNADDAVSYANLVFYLFLFRFSAHFPSLLK